MILKWLSPEGNAHLMDYVEEYVDHGWKTAAEIRELVARYDGEDVQVMWHLDVESTVVESEANTYHYAVISDGTERQHLVFQDIGTYLMSGEGKTVDRF